MKSKQRIWLGLAVSCVFVPGALLAQTAADARAFLFENMQGEWYGRGENSGSYASSKLVSATCDRIELQKCANNWIGYEYSTEADRVHYCWTETFDPTRVQATEIPLESDYTSRVGINCFSGECISSNRPATKPTAQLTDSITLVESARVKKAFDVFQASCGGPKKPVF